MNIALVSFDASGGLAAARWGLMDVLPQACRLEADIICFPEFSNSGFPTDDYKTDFTLAETIPGPLTEAIGEFARVYGRHIAIGLLERDGEDLYDTAVLFNPTGEIQLKYRRICTLWHAKDAAHYCEGDDLGITETPFGRMSFLLCGDLFDDDILELAHAQEPDFVIIPMARCLEQGTYDNELWQEELPEYIRQISELGCNAFLVNLFTDASHGAYLGGSMFINSLGEFHVAGPIGQPIILFLSVTPGASRPDKLGIIPIKSDPPK